MRVRVTSVFRDINTHEIYTVGAEREFDEARAKHLLSLGLVEKIDAPKPAAEPAPKEEKEEVHEQPAETAEVETKEETPADAEPTPEVAPEQEPAHEAEPAKEEEPKEKVVSERRRGRKTTKE